MLQRFLIVQRLNFLTHGSQQSVMQTSCPPRICSLRSRRPSTPDPAQLSLPLFDVVPDMPLQVGPEQVLTPTSVQPMLPIASRLADVVQPSALQALQPSEVIRETTPAERSPRALPQIRAQRAGDRLIQFGALQLPYLLKRSTRKSIGFLIDDDGLRVTAPRWVSMTEIEHSLREKEAWILRKLLEWQERKRHQSLPDIDWQAGATLPYLGRNIRIDLGAAATHLNPVQGSLCCALPLHAAPQQIKDTLHAWLQHEAQRIFGERMLYFVNAFELPLQEWRLSAATSQWGSCTATGVIRLNWRLIHFPLHIIDYVIAHELAHLKQMNHSPRFWAVVEHLLPDYREARQFLRRYHPEHLPLFD